MKAKNNIDGKEHDALSSRKVSWDYINKEISALNEEINNVAKEKKRRDVYKKWFSKISRDKRADIIAAWSEVHSKEVKGFADKYLKALLTVKKRLDD